MTANANPEKLACTIKYPVLDISNQLITDIVQIYHAALVGSLIFAFRIIPAVLLQK